MTLPNLQDSNLGTQQNQQQNQEQLNNSQSQIPQDQLNTQIPGGGQFNQQQQNVDPNVAIMQALSNIGQELAQVRNQNQMLQFQLNNRQQQSGFPGQQQTPQVPQQQQFKTPTKDEFWENPGEHTTRIVENLMQRSIAPLQQGVGFFMAQQQYQTAKMNMKNMQQFAALQYFEDIFDQLINQNLMNGAQLSEGLLITTYHTAFGIAASQGRFQQQMGGTQQFQQQYQNQPQLQNQPQGNYQSQPMVLGINGQPPQNTFQQQQTTPQNRTPQLVTPPYLQTNGGNNQRNGVNIKLRELTENEETVRRRSGQSHAEFLFYGDEIGLDILKAADEKGYNNYMKIKGGK